MKKAIVIYNSKTGNTKKFGENINQFLLEKNLNSEIIDIETFNNDSLSNYDLIFLGCWTSGLLLFLQKPEKAWVEFAKRLPVLESSKTILFTTYKIRTGTMFKNMKRNLNLKEKGNDMIQIASLDGKLTKTHKSELTHLIESIKNK